MKVTMDMIKNRYRMVNSSGHLFHFWYHLGVTEKLGHLLLGERVEIDNTKKYYMGIK